MSLPSDPNQTCLFCGHDFGPRSLDSPPTSIDETTGHESLWCSAPEKDCWNKWADQDPKRREGWITLSDLTPEQVNEVFNAVGLRLEVLHDYQCAGHYLL